MLGGVCFCSDVLGSQEVQRSQETAPWLTDVLVSQNEGSTSGDPFHLGVLILKTIEYQGLYLGPGYVCKPQITGDVARAFFWAVRIRFDSALAYHRPHILL